MATRSLAAANSRAIARPIPREAPVIRTARPLIRSLSARRLARAIGGNRRLRAVMRRHHLCDDLAVDPDALLDRLWLARLPSRDSGVRVLASGVGAADVGHQLARLSQRACRVLVDRLDI